MNVITPPRPLVLLHGWGLSASVWKPLLQHLDPTRQVLTLDLPGHGQATGVADDTLAGWAATLAPNLPAGCVLVGWSLGAQLALHLAQQHPTQIARLVLIGASPCFTTRDDWPHGLPAAALDDFRQQFTHDPDATQRRFVALQSLGDRARKQVSSVLGATLTSADGLRQTALASGLRLLAETDLRTLVTQIEQPVRMLHGDADRLMPVAAAEWLADALPQGRLSVFGQCGHAPFLSRPGDCACLIEGFADE